MKGSRAHCMHRKKLLVTYCYFLLNFTLPCLLSQVFFPFLSGSAAILELSYWNSRFLGINVRYLSVVGGGTHGHLFMGYGVFSKKKMTNAFLHGSVSPSASLGVLPEEHLSPQSDDSLSICSASEHCLELCPDPCTRKEFSIQLQSSIRLKKSKRSNMSKLRIFVSPRVMVRRSESLLAD